MIKRVPAVVAEKIVRKGNRGAALCHAGESVFGQSTFPHGMVGVAAEGVEARGKGEGEDGCAGPGGGLAEASTLGRSGL